VVQIVKTLLLSKYGVLCTFYGLIDFVIFDCQSTAEGQIMAKPKSSNQKYKFVTVQDCTVNSEDNEVKMQWTQIARAVQRAKNTININR